MGGTISVLTWFSVVILIGQCGSSDQYLLSKLFICHSIKFFNYILPCDNFKNKNDVLVENKENASQPWLEHVFHLF